MPLVIICDGGHARLPDPWEVGPAADPPEPCVACGADTRLHEEPPDYEPGLGPFPPGYDIPARLEGATMGEVYRARHRPTGRLVALKLSPPPPHARPSDLVEIRREARKLGALDHPHVVRLLESGEFGGRAYLALEWLPGGTLADRLAAGPLPEEAAVALAIKLAGAVHHAHRRRVVHRDVKPSNIAFGSDGEPRLLDFGLAKRLDRTFGRTPRGPWAGDPRYMAPEQGDEAAEDIGPEADVHAVGAVLYQALTGSLPFRGACFQERLRRADFAVPPPSTLRPGLPTALDGICLRCLEREPGRRHTTAEALAEDLRHVLDRGPVLGPPRG